MRKFLLVLWFCGWALFGFPWTSFSRRPRFYRIDPNPFGPNRRRDLILNFVYYVPFGVIAAWLGWHPVLVTGTAAILSGTTELVQVFSTSRFPSEADLLLNTGGALVGLAFVTFLRERARQHS